VILNIRHIGIVTDNLEKSLRFYRDLLGFTITKQLEERGPYINNMLALQDVVVTTIKLAAPSGQQMELLYFPSHPRSIRPIETCEIGMTHFAITVDDLDKAYVTLQNAGVLFNSPPQLSPDGGVKVTYCKAPEGTFVELVQELRTSKPLSK
jgi:catechol 2,3-dioxygenase-like lactoylglutathione lyase family enzyme